MLIFVYTSMGYFSDKYSFLALATGGPLVFDNKKGKGAFPNIIDNSRVQVGVVR